MFGCVGVALWSVHLCHVRQVGLPPCTQLLELGCPATVPPAGRQSQSKVCLIDVVLVFSITNQHGCRSI